MGPNWNTFWDFSTCCFFRWKLIKSGSTQFVLFLVSLNLASEIASPKLYAKWHESIYQVSCPRYLFVFRTLLFDLGFMSKRPSCIPTKRLVQKNKFVYKVMYKLMLSWKGKFIKLGILFQKLFNFMVEINRLNFMEAKCSLDLPNWSQTRGHLIPRNWIREWIS